MSSNPEQRNKTRFPHVSQVTHEDLDTGLYAQSKMFNYSKDGLYFESDMKMEVGDRVFIGIENSPYVQKQGVYECYYAEIQWRKPLESSGFKFGYGVQYREPGQEGSPHGVEQDMQPARKPNQNINVRKDGRKHPRYEFDRTVDGFTGNQAFRGRIKNISSSGAFVETDQIFSVGQRIVLALPFVKREEGAMVKAEVIWKNTEGIGIKFKKTHKK